jgi:hypothetical protein
VGRGVVVVVVVVGVVDMFVWQGVAIDSLARVALRPANPYSLRPKVEPHLKQLHGRFT